MFCPNEEVELQGELIKVLCKLKLKCHSAAIALKF